MAFFSLFLLKRAQLLQNSGETFEYKIDSKPSLRNEKNYPKMIF